MKKLLIILLFAPVFCFSQYVNWDAVYTGTTENKAIYVGEKLVWEKEIEDSVVIDGYTYPTVKIGNQTWLKVNLYYNDGDGGIYSYNNEPNTAAVYGYLYTWDAAMRVDSLIAGWHLPGLDELLILTNYLGGESVVGDKLKEVGYVHWSAANYNATNSSGFTALGAGTYNSIYASFFGLKDRATFWTSKISSLYRSYYYTIISSGTFEKNYGNNTLCFSVRLIKDSE